MGVLKKKVREKTMVIKHMKHTPTLVMRTLEMVVRPMIRYSMPIGIMRWVGRHHRTKQYILDVTAKHIVGLSTHTSNWNVMRPTMEQGMGVDPLHLTYITAIIQNTQKVINTPGDMKNM